MRLIKQNIERDGSGTITLFPEEPEDMVRTFGPAFNSSRLTDGRNSGTLTILLPPLTSFVHLPFVE
jgi:hypothetical protein